MARTTLDLDPSVLRELAPARSARGQEHGPGGIASFSPAPSPSRRGAGAATFAWATAPTSGRPRVDLEDKEAVRRVLDDTDERHGRRERPRLRLERGRSRSTSAPSELVRRLAAGPELVYLFWPVLMGYLRIVTHPAILPDARSPRRSRCGTSRRSWTGPTFARPARPTASGRSSARRPATASRGNDVPDAHLAALMRQHGVRVIYTRDRDFRRFDGIEPRDPFAT